VISEEKKKLGLLDLATQLKLKQQAFAEKQGIRLHGELKDRKGRRASAMRLCSKATHCRAAEYRFRLAHSARRRDRVCSLRIGTTDVFNSWITKDVRVKVPDSVRIVIHGRNIPTSQPKTSF